MSLPKPARKRAMSRRAIVAAVALGAALAALAIGVFLHTHRTIPRIADDRQFGDSIRFFALGDQGTGGFRQWQVAYAMESVAERDGQLDFVALLGDNFYRAARAARDDPDWSGKFERVYAGRYLGAVPFFAVLGNHDHAGYGEAESAELETRQDGARSLASMELAYARDRRGSNRWRMPNYWYREDIGKVGDRPLLRIVFIDTSLSAEGLAKEAEFIKAAFRETDKAPIWRVAIGHHPFTTYGAHRGKVAGVEALILPALREAQVDFYLSGHDHNQQVIAREGEPVQVINGGGGGELYAIRHHAPDLLFSRSGYGFVRARADKDAFEIGHSDEYGRVVSSFRIERACPRGQARCLVAVPPATAWP